MSDIYMIALKFLSEHFTSAPLSASNIIFHGHALENLKCHLIDLNGRETAVTGEDGNMSF